ncbi:Tetratricopeptide repeat protein 4 [Porites harrisoni]
MARSPITASKEGEATLAAEETLHFDDDNLRAIAEVYKNEGNDEYKQNNFNNAVQFYTEGIEVNCKDEELNAILYSNRAAARFNLEFNRSDLNATKSDGK